METGMEFEEMLRFMDSFRQVSRGSFRKITE